MRHALLLALLAAPAWGQVNLGSPVPLPPATNLATNPHFAAMQKQSRESGRDVYMRLHEQGSPAPRWFKCDPQGWISYGEPPAPAPLPAPRREVRAPVGTTFRGPVPNAAGDHACPRCRREVTLIAGPGPVPGTHLHRCPCGVSFFH